MKQALIAISFGSSVARAREEIGAAEAAARTCGRAAA